MALDIGFKNVNSWAASQTYYMQMKGKFSSGPCALKFKANQPNAAILLEMAISNKPLPLTQEGVRAWKTGTLEILGDPLGHFLSLLEGRTRPREGEWLAKGHTMKSWQIDPWTWVCRLKAHFKKQNRLFQVYKIHSSYISGHWQEGWSGKQLSRPCRVLCWGGLWAPPAAPATLDTRHAETSAPGWICQTPSVLFASLCLPLPPLQLPLLHLTEFSFCLPHIQNSLSRILLTWLETILYTILYTCVPEVDTSLTQVSSEAAGLPYVQPGDSSLWIRPRLPHQLWVTRGTGSSDAVGNLCLKNHCDLFSQKEAAGLAPGLHLGPLFPCLWALRQTGQSSS